jgi:hypothetical protein
MVARRALPVLREAEFRSAVEEINATVEIECLEAPDPARRHRGQWVVYVVRANGEKSLLITALAQERIMFTMEGVVSFAATKLLLGSVTVPLIAGTISRGMAQNKPVGS